MKIELGKFYKRRDGEIAGPVSQGSGFGDSDSADFFTTPEPNPEKRGPSNITYFENGYFYRHSKDSWDLVEEVPPPSSLPDPRDARIVELEAQLDEEKRACAALRKCDEDIIRERDQLRAELREAIYRVMYRASREHRDISPWELVNELFGESDSESKTGEHGEQEK